MSRRHGRFPLRCTNSPMTMPSIPTVDISPLRLDPTGGAASGLIDELLDHFHRIGFVQVVGHGVDPDLDRRLLDAAEAFFALPEQDRSAIAIENSAAFRGYTILGDERTQGLVDWRDQLDYGPEQSPPPDGDGPAWLRLRGPNQWPEALPGLAPVALEWMEAVTGVGVIVLQALAKGLGLPRHHFDAGFVPRHDVHVKIIRYPVTESTDQGVGLHHDTGLLTFILQNGVAGLQVQLGDDLVTVEPTPDAYVLNLGAMLQTATDGYLRATRHRVVSPSPGETDRISVALFCNPTFESTFEPIELPEHLAHLADPDPTDLTGDAIHTLFGENNLKVRMRSHPDVARRHYADVAPPELFE